MAHALENVLENLTSAEIRLIAAQPLTDAGRALLYRISGADKPYATLDEMHADPSEPYADEVQADFEAEQQRDDGPEDRLALDGSELTGGHWVTMSGSHVYIGGDGNIKAAPAHLKHLIGTKAKSGEHGPSESKHDHEEKEAPADFAHKAKMHGGDKLREMKKESQGGLFKKGTLSKAENDAMDKYSGDHYVSIRSREMGKQHPYGLQGKAMDDLHKHFKSGYEKLPDHAGTAYRGMKVNAETLEKLKHGGTVDLPATASFSRHGSIAHQFATRPAKAGEDFGDSVHPVVYKMDGKFKEMSHLSKYGDAEGEVLGGKGAKFHVTKTYMAKSPTGKKVLVVEGHQA